ncbi:MAG: gluconate:H+ symporter [Bacteroidota bacterium]
MIDYPLLLAVLGGIALLLVLILVLRFQAFLALLISCVCVGLLSGLPPQSIIDSIKNGMGSTLGFVATVVGLGAIFGAILEYSGGAKQLATQLLRLAGDRGTPLALLGTGILVSIPIFFDVAVVILVPIVYALQRKTGKSLLFFAIPLFAGLAIAHGFIPPTPGPIAVAEILKANLGWVIGLGIIVSIPTAVIGGLIYSRYLSAQIFLSAPETSEEESASEIQAPSASLIFFLIVVPILLIVGAALIPEGWGTVYSIFQLIGHPFVALILANLLAWLLLGVMRGVSLDQLLTISTKSLAPAGIIILLTGAGGAFKQILIDTGAGTMMAEMMQSWGISTLVFAFFAATVVRVLQGSTTVAMITAASLVAPLLLGTETEAELALLTLAIASGATMLSHVNDSGFWLVNKYLDMTTTQTFKAWTGTTGIMGTVGFVMVLLLDLIF